MIPIYRAKKKYLEGNITGYLVKQTLDTSDKCFIINWFMPDTIEQDNGYVEIDKSTLAISFDDGDEWYSMKELEQLMVLASLTYCTDRIQERRQ